MDAFVAADGDCYSDDVFVQEMASADQTHGSGTARTEGSASCSSPGKREVGVGVLPRRVVGETTLGRRKGCGLDLKRSAAPDSATHY